MGKQRLGSSHPYLLTTQRGIKYARQLIEAEGWARNLCTLLVREARTLAEQSLPIFEVEWWETARQRHWQENYVEIHHHCGVVPGPIVRSAFRTAIAYALTGESELAQSVLRVLRHAAGYSFAFKHPDVGMEYAGWGLRALQAYDLVYDCVAPDDRSALDDLFARMLAAVMANDQWWIAENPGGLFNNHFAWHKLLIGALGLFYQRDDLLIYALEGDQGFRELIEHGLLDDGLWFESSIQYHFVALLPMMMMAEMLRNSGHSFDLFTHQFANGRTLRDALRGPIEVAFPDLTVPTIGDCYGKARALPDWGVYEAAWNAYRDPSFAWLLTKRRGGIGQPAPERLFVESPPDSDAIPEVVTRDFPEHGCVMLRSDEGSSYWWGEGFTAFLSYDRNSIHSHRDKLSLILYGRGAMLAPDCEAVTSEPQQFAAAVQRELNRSTLCHNTVMVDGVEHYGVGDRLSLIEFKRLPAVKTATIADLNGRVHPDVRMQRTVAVTADYVLDVLQLVAETEHTYNWLFHANADDGTTCLSGDFMPIALPNGAPWSWLRNARARAEDRTWKAEWTIGDLTLRLTMLGESDTELTLYSFPRDDQYRQPPYAMLTAHRCAGQTAFIAVYQAERGELPEVMLSVGHDRHGAVRVTVSIAGRRVEHLLPGLAV